MATKVFVNNADSYVGNALVAELSKGDAEIIGTLAGKYVFRNK